MAKRYDWMESDEPPKDCEVCKGECVVKDKDTGKTVDCEACFGSGVSLNSLEGESLSGVG